MSEALTRKPKSALLPRMPCDEILKSKLNTVRRAINAKALVAITCSNSVFSRALYAWRIFAGRPAEFVLFVLR